MMIYLISSFRGHRFLAVKDEERNRVADLFFEEESEKIGNIYLGKIIDMAANVGGAFVSLGDEKAFLPLNEEELRTYHPQTELVLQVVKSAMKQKELRVSNKISITGKYAVLSAGGEGRVNISRRIREPEIRKELSELLPKFWEGEIPEKSEGQDFSELQKSVDVMLRTKAAEASEEEILGELSALFSLLSEILLKGKSRTCYSLLYEAPDFFRTLIRDEKSGKAEKIITDLPEVYTALTGKEKPAKKNEAAEFSGVPVYFYESVDLPLLCLYSVESVIGDCLKKKVWLKSGGYLIIEPTEAMTVVDVNTGKSVRKAEKEETFYRINLEAASELARQLRLRNLSGIVVVDFINMNSKEHRNGLLTHLSGELSSDPVETRLVDMTKLGLVELTRKKIRKPLSEVLS